MKRIGLVVAYDGTNYCGWQTQPNGITVQGVLNETLSELLGEKIETIGASRTDAGVHAMGNVAVFDTNTRIPGEKISYALNQRLPEDIRIQLSEEVEPDFHPRYCDSEKTYEYRILNRKFPVPTERLYTYFYHYKLDVDKMKAATSYLIGQHDFASFCGAKAQVKTTIRTVTGIDVWRDLDGLAAVAVLVLVAAAGELALDEDEAALAQVFADELGLCAPCDALDEVGDLLAVLGFAAGVAGEGEAGDRRALLRVPELRVGG